MGGMSFNNKVLHAYLLLKEGELEKANKLFALLSMDRLTPQQKLQLKGSYALVFWKNGEVGTAIEMLEEVIEKAPSTSVYGSLGYMYAFNNNLSRALEFNQMAYDYNNTNAIIVDNLAFTHYKRGEFEEAKKYYQELIKMQPSFPEAYYGYGRLLVEMGDRNEGIKMLKQALESNFSFLSMINKEEIYSFLNTLDNTE